MGLRVGIAGGGIGGLAAAIALARVDAISEIVVYERAPKARTRATVVGRGAALLVWSNAVSALTALGLRDAVLHAGAVIDITRIRAESGATLADLAVGEWSEAHGAPSLVIRRADLVDLLLAGLPEKVRVVHGVGLQRFSQSNGVEVTLTRGKPVLFDALVGCDGLSSAVRAQLFAEDRVRYAGYDAWVGIAPAIPAALRPGIALATIGRGPRFWTAALRGGAAFWYATLTEDGSSRVTDRASLARAFEDWPEPTTELIETTPDENIVRTRIRDRLPRTEWGEGVVTLLGDAAHPSTPDLGQGACQAIESAAFLGSEVDAALREGEPIETALRRYEQRRISHTATISRLCWMTSQSSTVESRLACELRDAAIRLALPAVARSSLKWIFSEASQLA